MRTKLFTMRVSIKWLKKMKELAESRGKDEGRDISVAELIRDACRILYKVKA